MAATVKETLARIEAHEKECAANYKRIEKRFDDGSKRFDKLDNRIMALYPFIVATVLGAAYLFNLQ
jgi:hypothetical protein|tara:strand:+ start:296 stop:493 length:198 start_codon:yes stop_codon:yes gene_type:complete